MDAFSPDFVPFWAATADASVEQVSTTDDRMAGGDEEALAELAERVVAARSIV